MNTFLLFILLSAPSAEALTNSTAAEEALFNAVTMIKVDARDEDGSLTVGYCNATIVTERRLVTAAHCLAHAWLLRSQNLELQIGRYKYRNDANGRPVRIGYATTQTIRDPSARFLLPASVEAKLERQGFKARIEPNEDNAMIELSLPLDLELLDIAPASLVNREEQAEVQRQGTSASFLAVTVNPVAEIASNDTRRKAALNRVSWKAGSLESRSQSRVEPMDSGAPLFVYVRGQWKLLAVVKGLAKTFFSEWDMFSILPN
jgi:hypothetical protein